MKPIGTFALSHGVQREWKELRLQRRWARAFPHLFDERDLALALGPQGRKGYHFVEWTGAILVSIASGYNALVAKYQYRGHPAKRGVVAALGLREVLRLPHPEFGRAQGPDLLMYRPDYADFFFCEVKGPGDRESAQQNEYFRYLEVETKRAVRLVRFRWEAVMRAGA